MTRSERIVRWRYELNQLGCRRPTAALVAEIDRLIPPATAEARWAESFATAIGVLVGDRSALVPEKVVKAVKTREGRWVVVLDDGETFSNLAGCRLVRLSQEEYDSDEIDEVVKQRYAEGRQIGIPL